MVVVMKEAILLQQEPQILAVGAGVVVPLLRVAAQA